MPYVNLKSVNGSYSLLLRILLFSKVAPLGRALQPQRRIWACTRRIAVFTDPSC